ncbi:RluA family pseudouridine synthase [Cytobacillus sp. FJAT-54145]|uniref:Pseudouridine synthase n=1 Tax=Cytobacillus spartinae TaxID=3299023 RepID=A0ABW6K9X8_9BACI
MSRFTIQWEIEEDEGKLIKDFLKENEISKASLTDIKINGGNILLNNQEVTVRKVLSKGDLLKVIFPLEEPSEGMLREDIPLDILYEDSFILVVNKPAGMSTIPSREHPTGSLANGLVGYYEKIGLQSTVHIVTRLDRDTSGLVLIAKHRHIHHLFSKQQKLRNIKRMYEALAEGTFYQVQGTIEKPIGRKKDSIIEREVTSEGQYACTHFKVLKQYTSFAHIQLQLETGRTHQIRVHLSHMGHPLIGDDLYGGSVSLLDRQALHCCQISFYHPILNEALFFEVPLAEDMKNIIKAKE